MKKKIISSILVVWFLQLLATPIGHAYSFEKLVNQQSQTISPGVLHSVFNYENSSGVKQSVNELEVDLLNPYASVEIGLSNPFTTIRKTSKLAELNNYANHHVVGAVNASYFASFGPMGLLVVNNELINHGILGSGVESPTTQPVAFGIGYDGKAIIGQYDLDIQFTIDGQVYDISNMDGERFASSNTLYTSRKESTGTNPYGMELIVSGVSNDTSKVILGEEWVGTVNGITPYFTTGNSTIPKDGFVISIQNLTLANELMNSMGKEVRVSFSIDQKWQNAKYILGAGPLLVQDGQINITMDQTSSFAKNRNPRTAVMIDDTGTRVKLITLDGRQPGYSSGSSLNDLASYAISKGAYAALNLDGGGSTTMVARFPGKQLATMVNKPSDVSERAVSAILQVINSASYGSLMNFEVTVPATVTETNRIDLKVANGYDEYYHPFDVTTAAVTWTVEGDIGYIESNQFVATKAGFGTISASINGVTISKSIEVVPYAEIRSIDALQEISKFTTSSIRGTTAVAASVPVMEASRGTESVLKLSYEMNVVEAGTSANYLHLNPTETVAGSPVKLGMWVYGDKKNHWLRSTIKDANGQEHTLDWTMQNGLSWSGWKFITTTIPTTVAYPIKVEKIYITEPVESMKSSGAIYLTDLKAIYRSDYTEPAFTDIVVDNWAGPAIGYFADKGYITGYMDGTFKPGNTITRGEAAVIIQRVLGITATNQTNPFGDVKATSYDYQAILALNEFGIMTGKSEGVFDPSGQLTRAEMAAILVRAFKLVGTATIPYPDVDLNNWATAPISTLVANNLVTGFSDGTYRPNAQISRAEFATFIYRVVK